ncbi:hypothetical protein EDE08_104225 [Bradyrhizobium sp. R2.2-H]|nr:hypothetical protein EDE10_104417 [Bradyrhizobium sp. Y-H1]TCU76060.1 hypothetical protein EDE08_104225 [Bradyrhizobium sp. R2.2-H]
MPGLVRPVTYFLRCGNVNGRDKPGHGDAQALVRPIVGYDPYPLDDLAEQCPR